MQTGTIRGQVVAADTGLPLRDAVVALQSSAAGPEPSPWMPGPRVGRPPAITVRVDDDGRFELRDVPPGRYRLGVNPGMGASRYIGRLFPDPDTDSARPLALAGGDVIDGLVLSVMPGAVITGRVLSGQGDPLSGVMVTAIELLPGGRQRTSGSRQVLGDRTDDLGGFRLYGLPPGEYAVLAQADLLASAMELGRGEGSLVVRGAPRISRGYYPGSAAGPPASGIRVEAGEAYGPVDVAMGPGPVSVRGIVLDPNGQPIGGARVALVEAMVVGAHSIVDRSASSAADGTFELNSVAPGEHHLEVTRHSMNPDDSGLQQALMRISVGTEDLDGVTVALRRAATIAGSVVFDGGRPPDTQGVMVRAVPLRSGPRATGTTAVQPEPDRSFKIDGMFGPLLIQASTPRGWTLKSVIYGGRDITEQPVEFELGGPPLVVTVTDRVASLSGRVTGDGGSPAAAAVLIFAEDPALWDERVTTTKTILPDDDGVYRAEDLRPGRYLVVAVPRRQVGAPGATASYFELLARYARPVTLNERDAAVVDLKVAELRP